MQNNTNHQHQTPNVNPEPQPQASANNVGPSQHHQEPSGKRFSGINPNATTKLIAIGVTSLIVLGLVLWGITSLHTPNNVEEPKSQPSSTPSASDSSSTASRSSQTDSLFGSRAYASPPSSSGSGKIIGIVGIRTTTRF